MWYSLNGIQELGIVIGIIGLFLFIVSNNELSRLRLMVKVPKVIDKREDYQEVTTIKKQVVRDNLTRITRLSLVSIVLMLAGLILR